jgi:hypothetical protein
MAFPIAWARSKGRLCPPSTSSPDQLTSGPHTASDQSLTAQPKAIPQAKAIAARMSNHMAASSPQPSVAGMKKATMRPIQAPELNQSSAMPVR